jgi:hypothetical protein
MGAAGGARSSEGGTHPETGGAPVVSSGEAELEPSAAVAGHADDDSPGCQGAGWAAVGAVAPLDGVYGNASPARAAPSADESSVGASAAGGTGSSGRVVPQFQQTTEDAKLVDEQRGQDHASPIDSASRHAAGIRRPPVGV